MPILAPLPALPTQIVTTYVIEPNSDTLEKRFSTFSPSTLAATRPPSYSFSSTSSKSSVPSRRPRTASASLSSSFRSRSSTNATTPSPPTPEEKLSEESAPSEPLAETQFTPFIIRGAANNESMAPGSLFPVERLTSLSERTLAMHLHRSYLTVVACQEPMYEELKFKIRSNPEELAALGWESDTELEGLETRQRFEKLIHRFRRLVLDFYMQS